MTRPDSPAPPNRETARRETIRFFALAYGITWLFWIPIAIFALSRPVGMPLALLGAFGPTVAAFVLSDRVGRRDLLGRFTDLKRIGLGWWLLILLFHPLVAIVSNWIGMRLGGPSVGLDRGTLGEPTAFLTWLLIMIIGGPLAEEFGWRGYALDRLQTFGGAVNASVALGILWALWHLPLFFIAGTSQGAMGFGTPGFWMWTTQVVALTAVYTWVYNNTGRSIFGAFLFHFMHNATFSALVGIGGRTSDEFEVGSTLVSVAAAIIVVAVWRAGATRAARAAS